jgi:hypothetical protein
VAKSRLPRIGISLLCPHLVSPEDGENRLATGTGDEATLTDTGLSSLCPSMTLSMFPRIFCKTGSCCIAQAGLKLPVLPQLPKGWDYRHIQRSSNFLLFWRRDLQGPTTTLKKYAQLDSGKFGSDSSSFIILFGTSNIGKKMFEFPLLFRLERETPRRELMCLS